MRARPDPETIKLRGAEARKRARIASGPMKNYKSSAWWPEVEAMALDGWTQAEIAEALQLSIWRIKQLKHQFDIKAVTIPRPRVLSDVHPEMADFSVDAFVAFFENYNSDGYTVPEHVRSWFHSFIANRNLLLNVPPRHAKSYYFSHWIPTWLICRDRNVQIILLSETKEFAKGWASEIAGTLESNQKIIADLGHFAPERKGDFAWRPEGGSFAVRGRTRHARGAQLTIQSRGMEQQILGMEADYVILDDPTNASKAGSETEHKAEMNHFYRNVMTRIEDINADGGGGRAVVIGQRVHPKDMYGELAGMKDDRTGDLVWHHEMHPAVLRWPETNNGISEVLWPGPGGKSFEYLMGQRQRIGGYEHFECMFQQNPSPEGTAIIRPEWFNSCKDRSRGGYEGIKEVATAGVSRVCSIDPSPNNYHGIIVADILWARDQFYCVVIEAKHMRSNLRDLTEDLRRIWHSYNIDYLVFEQSTFSKWFFEDPVYQELRENFRTIKHKTAANKHDAEYGIQSLAGDFEFNRISLPYGDSEGIKMTDLLGKEALHYPDGDYDDILMALWFIKYNWKRLRPVNVDMAPTAPGDGWSWMEQMKRKDRSKDNYRKVANVG